MLAYWRVWHAMTMTKDWMLGYLNFQTTPIQRFMYKKPAKFKMSAKSNEHMGIWWGYNVDITYNTWVLSLYSLVFQHYKIPFPVNGSCRPCRPTFHMVSQWKYLWWLHIGIFTNWRIGDGSYAFHRNLYSPASIMRWNKVFSCSGSMTPNKQGSSC